MMTFPNLTNIVVANIVAYDFPDFVDAYVESADSDGRPLTETELDYLNNCYPEIAQSYAYKTYSGEI